MKEELIDRLITCCFFVLLAGLLYTQIIRYPHYARLSQNNAIRILPIDGPRGTIFDRSGVPLVGNRLSFDVALIYQELGSRERLMAVLRDVGGLSRRELVDALDKASKKPFVPVTIMEDIDKTKALAIEEAAVDVRGLIVETRSRRDYPNGTVGAHVFGYLGEITEDELERMSDYGYRMRDMVGRSGIERQYNSYLAGIDGGMQVEVDNRGKQRRVLGIREPACGKDITLTIDADLQKLADKLLAPYTGVAIVMNPRTGEVLALASHPSFDPNIFVRPQTSVQRLALMRDRRAKPLVNRAIAGLYPPGSVFKIVVASAALELQKISTATTFQCAGAYHLGRMTLRCWKEGGHGSQHIIQALMNSCNVFFCNVGHRLGVDAIERYAKLFGYGRTSGIDLPDEAKGNVPGRLWKEAVRHEQWYEGETLNYSIGQGYLTVTPVQVLRMVAVIANNGYLVRPYLVKRIDTTDVASSKAKHVDLKDGTIQIVRKGLYDVVNGESGTGRRAQVKGVAVAGKTGTAQNPHGRSHGWFCGFAPYDDPKLCLVVFIEHGGHGGVEPAEIAHDLLALAHEKGYI